MLPTIKFRSHLHRSSGQSASAVMIISIDQHYQQGDEFKLFCSAINEEYEKKNLIKLTIVETGYLKRHYLRLDKNYPSIEEADLAAIRLGETWIKEQLSSLYSLNVPVEILSWKDLLEGQVNSTDKPFAEYLAITEETYKTDKVFIRDVDRLSKKYAEKLSNRYNPHQETSLNKACLDAAKNYLLEESSIIFKLIPRGFNAQLYPGTGNAALRYIYKKFFGETNPIPWIRYDIREPSATKEKKLKKSTSLFFESSTNSADSSQEVKNKVSSLATEEQPHPLKN